MSSTAAASPAATTSLPSTATTRIETYVERVRECMSNYTGVLVDPTDKNKENLERALAFLTKKPKRVAKYRDVIESLQWLLRCDCGDEDPSYPCSGCGVGLCFVCEVEVNDRPSGRCMRCYYHSIK